MALERRARLLAIRFNRNVSAALKAIKEAMDG